MNPDLHPLQTYPFEKLRSLKAGIEPPADRSPIMLSIGEPKHPTPDFIKQALMNNLNGLSNYPATKGSDALREAIAAWLKQRFHLPSLDAQTQVLPVNGTREALFAFAQAVIDRRQTRPTLCLPNPFYQIYEGAALLAGARPHFMNCTAASDFLPDLDAVAATVWQHCQLIYTCSPGNPTGAVMDKAYLRRLLELAEQYDFIIAADECYAELYLDEGKPPPGLLQVAAEMGNDAYQRCVVFHSLSKRSNAPGLRSGFVAGDAQVLQQFFLYRTYHGCAMSPPTQAASLAAWQDEAHVLDNRRLYRQKFAAVQEILAPVLDFKAPTASFYLWAHTPTADTEFTRALFAQQNVTLLPGSYLSRETEQGNPGANYVRIALVAEMPECVAAAQRMRRFLEAGLY